MKIRVKVMKKLVVLETPILFFWFFFFASLQACFKAVVSASLAYLNVARLC